jgi:hypothetical protein
MPDGDQKQGIQKKTCTICDASLAFSLCPDEGDHRLTDSNSACALSYSPAVMTVYSIPMRIERYESDKSIAKNDRWSTSAPSGEKHERGKSVSDP